MDKRTMQEKLYHYSPEEADEAEARTEEELQAEAVSQIVRSRVVLQGKSEVLSATITTVPSTKRLVVDFITADIRIEDSSELVTVYVYSLWPVTHFLIPTKVYNYYAGKVGATMDRWYVSQPTGLVAQPGEEIRVVAVKNNVLGNMQAAFTLFGHYEDL